MELFGLKFREYIECQGYSIRQFAKETGFDRCWLTNILNNKKKLPESSFSQLINNNYFSEEQINKLKYIYYSATYTEKEFEHIEYILKTFKTPETNINYYPECFSYNDSSAVIGYKNVLSLLYNFFYNENKYYYIYSNIPASKTEPVSIIYNFLKQRGTDDYRHILYLDHGVSTHNLCSYFLLINFAQIGYKVSLLKNVNTTQMETLDSFPYYIIINNKMILFDSYFESAFYIDDSIKINLYQKAFQKIYVKSEQITKFFNNPIDYINTHRHYNSAVTSHEIISCEYNLAPILTEDLYNSNINRNFPNRKYIISTLNSYYSLPETNTDTLFLTVNALSNFMDSGRIAQFPESYFDSLSINQRISMLSKQKEAAVLKRCNIKLINPTKLDYSTYTFDSDNKNLLNVTGSCDSTVSTNKFLGNYSVLIEDKSVIKDFCNTLDFIRNNYIYSDEYYIRYLDNCINELKSRIIY